MSLKEQMQNIASDLFNLEILTIVKPNITGRKMPVPRKALEEIAKKYNFKLKTLGCGFDDNKLKAQNIVLGSYNSFEKLLAASKNKINKDFKGKERLNDDQEGTMWMLYRIKSMCATIIDIFDSLKGRGVEDWQNDLSRIKGLAKSSLKANPDELVKIRKAWELGVEEIVMKTIVQLDGDVITRVKKKYTDEKYQSLREMHQQGVRTSVDFWQTLVGIALSILKSLWKNIIS